MPLPPLLPSMPTEVAVVDTNNPEELPEARAEGEGSIYTVYIDTFEERNTDILKVGFKNPSRMGSVGFNFFLFGGGAWV